MTYFAAVAPLTVHKQMEAAGTLGPYNLLIASEILKDFRAHREFWHRRAGFVIMDNGVIETGAPLPLNDLAVAAETVHADVVVLPDTIDDANMTRKQVRHANVEWKRGPVPHVKTLGVVQGRTFAECIDCADSHMQSGVDYLAVPRGLTPNLGSRYDLVQALSEEHPSIEMHILGFSENIDDDILSAASSSNVMGLDAATPVWLGMGGRKAPLPMTPPRTANYGRRPEWFWQAGAQSADSFQVLNENVLRVRSWLDERVAGIKLSLALKDRSAVKDALTRKAGQ